jgi:hypothetical protein
MEILAGSSRKVSPAIDGTVINRAAVNQCLKARIMIIARRSRKEMQFRRKGTFAGVGGSLLATIWK